MHGAVDERSRVEWSRARVGIPKTRIVVRTLARTKVSSLKMYKLKKTTAEKFIYGKKCNLFFKRTVNLPRENMTVGP